MAVPDLPDRVDALEQLQDQQRRLNEQLLLLNARLRDDQDRTVLTHQRAETILLRLDEERARHAARLDTLGAQLTALTQTQAAALASLQRAQDLHDATLRRHGEFLERDEARMAQHEAQMAELRQILQAIKDLLPRGNGH
jgi:chromosome segregation ATPase